MVACLRTQLAQKTRNTVESETTCLSSLVRDAGRSDGAARAMRLGKKRREVARQSRVQDSGEHEDLFACVRATMTVERTMGRRVEEER